MVSPISLDLTVGQAGAPTMQSFAGAQYQTRRLYVVSTSTPFAMVAPAAGGRVDGISLPFNHTLVDAGPPAVYSIPYGWPACPGLLVSVEAGGSFLAGALLETTSNGRVIAQSSGRVVMRALSASAGAGSFVWAVFTQP